MHYLNTCQLVCEEVNLCQQCVYFFTLLLYKLSFCRHCLCFSCVCVCGISVSSCLLRFNAPWLFWRSEMTPWERGQSSLPPLHLLLFPSFHLSIFPFMYSFLSLGMWTLLNFPLGGWRKRQEGIRGVIPSAAFIYLSAFIPAWGLWLLGPCAWKGNRGTSALIGHCTSWQLPDSIWRSESRKEIFKKLSLPVHIVQMLHPLKSDRNVKTVQHPPQSSSINRK